MPLLDLVGPQGGRTQGSPPTGGRTALEKFGALPMPSLTWNAEVERETAHLYERIKNVVPSVEWPFFAPYACAINALKKERNAAVWRTTTRRRKSTTASPMSSATAFSSPARRPR